MATTLPIASSVDMEHLQLERNLEFIWLLTPDLRCTHGLQSP